MSCFRNCLIILFNSGLSLVRSWLSPPQPPPPSPPPPTPQPLMFHRTNRPNANHPPQWLGDDKLRRILEGKLLLVHLVCKKRPPPSSNVASTDSSSSSLRGGGGQSLPLTVSAASSTSPSSQSNKRQIFRPCVALRVAGSPGNDDKRYITHTC